MKILIESWFFELLLQEEVLLRWGRIFQPGYRIGVNTASPEIWVATNL